MTDIPEPDLAPPHPLLAAPAGPPDERQREAVFARTARILWRRRLARRLAHATVLVACFVAGLLTMYWLRPPAPPRESVTINVVPAPAPAPTAPGPSALERQANQKPEDRRDLFRRAGDLYATEHGDLQAALRCYGRSLDAGTASDLAISPNDHWLLMAIKDARQKEKNDAKTSQ